MRTTSASGGVGKVPMNRAFVPEPIYKLLPAIYVVSGIITPFYVDHFMAIVSGILLVSAGIIVFMWRSEARGRARRMRKARQRATARTDSTGWQ